MIAAIYSRVSTRPAVESVSHQARIGNAVCRGEEVARVGDAKLLAPLEGVLRGLTRDAVPFCSAFTPFVCLGDPAHDSDGGDAFPARESARRHRPACCPGSRSGHSASVGDACCPWCHLAAPARWSWACGPPGS